MMNNIIRVDTAKSLRKHVITCIKDNKINIDIDDAAYLLQPFDDIIEPHYFCRHACNNNHDNICELKRNGHKCDWHQGYD